MIPGNASNALLIIEVEDQIAAITCLGAYSCMIYRIEGDGDVAEDVFDNENLCIIFSFTYAKYKKTCTKCVYVLKQRSHRNVFKMYTILNFYSTGRIMSQ
jgi:hypothetical protein